MNDDLLATFDEEQIFRIDHYLGKEMIKVSLQFVLQTLIFEKCLEQGLYRQCSNYLCGALGCRRTWWLL